MTQASDPQLYSSGYERNRFDRYWTNPWMTLELVKHLKMLADIPGPIWECAAGRGDISRALKESTCLGVYSSDVDISEFDTEIGPSHERSFLEEIEVPEVADKPCRSIITNPPYSKPWRGIADEFIEAGLDFMADGQIDFMAMLMRSEFKSGKSKRRRHKFGDCSYYAGELVLTTRPRWDYGDPNAPEKAAPRHNFSWFIWSKQQISPFHPIQLFSYMPRGFQP
jgi:predicted RNA methylase